jgi:hypothetical protein
MTLAEIDKILPNGFHDALVEKFTWNFQEESAVFDIDFLVGTPESRDDDVWSRRGRIQLQGVLFISIDPPEPSDSDPKPFKPSGSFQIDGLEANDTVFPALPKLKPNLPLGTQIYSFYVANLNSFIHISAKNAALEWLDSEKPGQKGT